MVTLTIEQHAASLDLYIQIPQHIRQELNWEEGDTLVWQIQGDNTISIKKECQQTNYNWHTVKEKYIQDYYNSESEGKDFDQQYEAYLYSFSPEAEGSWGKTH